MPAKKRKLIDKVAATVVIIHPDQMSPKGRREVAGWLEGVARNLVNEGSNYSARFTARYWYKEGK